jgi:hypothetical protein
VNGNAALNHNAVYFEPAQAGRSLKEVGVDFLDIENQRITSRWFRSGMDVDLFIWLDAQNKVIKQQMSFCGQIVEWNILDGLKTGAVIEEESSETDSNGENNSSEVIRFDQKPQAQAIRMALEVIQNMEPLNVEEKNDLLTNFGAHDLPRLLGGLGKGSMWQRFRLWLSGNRKP